MVKRLKKQIKMDKLQKNKLQELQEKAPKIYYVLDKAFGEDKDTVLKYLETLFTTEQKLPVFCISTDGTITSYYIKGGFFNIINKISKYRKDTVIIDGFGVLRAFNDLWVDKRCVLIDGVSKYKVYFLDKIKTLAASKVIVKREKYKSPITIEPKFGFIIMNNERFDIDSNIRTFNQKINSSPIDLDMFCFNDDDVMTFLTILTSHPTTNH